MLAPLEARHSRGGGAREGGRKDHGFHADDRPGYRKAAAEDGWLRMPAWFKRFDV